MASNELPFDISPDAIAQQRAEVLTTATYHGLNERNAVIVGGAGLALRGLHTVIPMLADRMPKNGLSPFDVDAVAVPGSDLWPKGLVRRGTLNAGASAAVPLPLTLKRGNGAREFAYSRFGYPSLEAMVADSEVVDDLAVLSLKGILESKILGNRIVRPSDRVKDRVGVLGAHMIARAYDNPVADDPYWQSAVQTVMQRLDPNRQDAPLMGRDPMLPGWVNDLRMSNFDHPAFEEFHVTPPGAA